MKMDVKMVATKMAANQDGERKLWNKSVLPLNWFIVSIANHRLQISNLKHLMAANKMATNQDGYQPRWLLTKMAANQAIYQTNR